MAPPISTEYVPSVVFPLRVRIPNFPAGVIYTLSIFPVFKDRLAVLKASKTILLDVVRVKAPYVVVSLFNLKATGAAEGALATTSNLEVEAVIIFTVSPCKFKTFPALLFPTVTVAEAPPILRLVNSAAFNTLKVVVAAEVIIAAVLDDLFMVRSPQITAPLSFALVPKVVTPVTAKVEDKVVAPVTPKVPPIEAVPAITVFPESAAIVNLLVFILKVPATSNVPVIEVEAVVSTNAPSEEAPRKVVGFGLP